MIKLVSIGIAIHVDTIGEIHIYPLAEAIDKTGDKSGNIPDGSEMSQSV